MPNYTLYYFNGRGRAEICRMMFAAAGVKYMDKRFEFNEWDKYRNDMPSMCVPVLDIDGKQKMPETMAICRYLAREFSFYPKSSMDMFRCDYIADCFYEIMHDYMRYYHWKNGRFRFNCNMVGSGMMGSGAGMMGSGPGMMGSGAGMMGSGAGMMGSGPGMMGSGPGMMGSGPGMMGSGPGMMSPDSSSMSSSSSSSMMSPDSSIMSPGAGMMSRGAGMSRAGGMMSPGMSGMMQSGMPSSGMMGNGGNMMSSGMDSGMMSSDNSNYDQYMYWRYMNSFNRIMPFMERTLNMRKSGSHFFMGEQMMWCDMMFYCCMENMYMQNQSMFSSYPKMMALYKRVASHPKICGYLKKRCNTSW